MVYKNICMPMLWMNVASALEGSRLETGRWKKSDNIQVPSEEILCLDCFENGFIETENKEHFHLCCLHPTPKYIEKTFCIRSLAIF